MKANEAPEKIYLTSNDNEAFVFTKKRTDNKGVEYIRTDAFIEKALKWIDDTFHGTSIDSFGGESVDVVMSEGSVYKCDLIEDFKKYMED